MDWFDRIAFAIWRDRRWQDNLGQPFVERCAISKICLAVRRAGNASDHWMFKAVFAAALSVGVAFITAKITADNRNSAQEKDMRELNARITLLQGRLQILEARIPSAGIDLDKDSVTGTYNHSIHQPNANKQPAPQAGTEAGNVH